MSREQLEAANGNHIILTLDTGELERYAKTVDDLTLPEAKLVWCDRDTAQPV